MDLLLTGLYIGAIHILGSPDHLAVLFSLSLLNQEKSIRIGILWSIGHVLGIALIGGILYYTKSLIPLEKLAPYSILYVGLLLLLIGGWIIYQSRKKIYNHSKSNMSKLGIGVGFFHGIFSFSHIYSLLPSISMEDSDFFAYFFGFSLGGIITVIGLLYFLVHIPFFSNTKLHQKITLYSGYITLAIGIGMIILHYGFGHTHH